MTNVQHHLAYIGMGANLPWQQFSAKQTLSLAAHHIASLSNCQLIAHASLYQTSPVDAVGDDYINTVVALRTSLSPHELLQSLQQIEQTFDRQRAYINAPRTLDLDILLYDDLIINTTTLIIPHPRLTQRAFALTPLAEIAPELTIKTPLKNQSIKMLVDQIKHDATQQITRLNDLWYPQPDLLLMTTVDH